MIPLNVWHNTGGNGQAIGVWTRTVDDRTANIFSMPYRCMVDLWEGKVRTEEGIPFESLDRAKDFADAWLGSREDQAPEHITDEPTVKLPRQTMRELVFGNPEDCDATNGFDDTRLEVWTNEGGL